MDMTDKEVEDYLNEAAATMATVKLPLFIDNEYAVDKITGIIQDLSASTDEKNLEIIISSPPALAHTRIDAAQGKAEACAALVERLHHDIMPYTIVIISVPKAAEGALAEACRKHGVYGSVESDLK